MHRLQQIKTVKMFYAPHSPVYVEVPVSNNQTEILWASDGFTLGSLRGRINEVSNDYYGELPLSATTTTSTMISTSLNSIDNKCSTYLGNNVLIGFSFCAAAIILLLLLNIISMFMINRSKHRQRIENISGETLRLNDMFSDLNHATRQQ